MPGFVSFGEVTAVEWLQANALWLVLILLAAILLWRSFVSQREQRRAMNRMRQNAEQQGRAILQLNQELEEVLRQIAGQTEAFSQRQDRLRDSMDQRFDALRQSNERKLDQMRETVAEKLDGRLNESFRTVNRQLADVHRGLGEMHALVGEFSDLKKVLGGVKTRGVWGEIQLRALLEQVLAPEQYIENAAIPENSLTRVEFAVRMPAVDGEALLPIDSKFPQEDFLRLVEAANSGDAQQLELCGAKLERALTEQAKLISEKYIRPPQTADFAVMFLPVESLYAEAVRRTGLCERLQSRFRVLVAGPNTLAALLTSLRMGFRTVTLEKRSGEVLKLLSEVRTEFDKYEEAADQVRRRLEQTGEALETMNLRARRLSRRLKDVSEAQGEGQ